MDNSISQGRAAGALAGVALGDAMGMPSQTLTRAAIHQAYGRISDFVAPMAGHPVSHGLSAAQITDDTEQTLLLAKLLIQGQFSDEAWATALLEWEKDVRARGLHDLLGPSSKAALEALIAGVPATQTGLHGTTNGAAMRIVPIGILMPVGGARLVDKVEAVCRVTHATGEAVGGAAAVASVVSQGVNGLSFDATLEAALEVARIGCGRGNPIGERDMASRISLALHVAKTGDEAALAAQIGTSVASREAVAAAFGVVRLAKGDPWKAAVISANIGDDTDTIGAMACAMCGACGGLSAFPAAKLEVLKAVNQFDPEAVASDLLVLRAQYKEGAA